MTGKGDRPRLEQREYEEKDESKGRICVDLRVERTTHYRGNLIYPTIFRTAHAFYFAMHSPTQRSASLANTRLCHPRSEKSRVKSSRGGGRREEGGGGQSESQRNGETWRKTSARAKRGRDGRTWEKRNLVLSKQRDLSLAKGQRASGGLYTDIVATMGPFVLCSAFLITPCARARADTPRRTL